jgi:serine/threonine protein kinase
MPPAQTYGLAIQGCMAASTHQSSDATLHDGVAHAAYLCSCPCSCLQPEAKAYRDWKPDNLVFDEATGLFVLMDFGFYQALVPNDKDGYMHGLTYGELLSSHGLCCWRVQATFVRAGGAPKRQGTLQPKTTCMFL